MERPKHPEDLKGKQGSTSGPVKRSTQRKWTPEEDEVLREAVEHYKGKNWKMIAKCLEDRTEKQCRHRWRDVLNPDIKKGSWSKEEDEKLIALVQQYGQKWSTISQHLPGRIGKQCRERWHNHLDPEINKNAWTEEEEQTLIREHQKYGNKWVELMKYLPGRSANSINNHWKNSVRKKLDSYPSSSPSRANKISFPREDKPAEKDKRALSYEPSSSPSAEDPSFDNKDDHVPSDDDVYHNIASWNDQNLLYNGETSVGLDDSDFFPTVRTKNDQLQGVSNDAEQDLDLDLLLTPTMDDNGKNQALKSLVRLGDQPSSPNLDTDPETETAVFTDEELLSFFASDDDDDITEQQELPKMNEDNNQLRD